MGNRYGWACCARRIGGICPFNSFGSDCLGSRVGHAIRGLVLYLPVSLPANAHTPALPGASPTSTSIMVSPITNVLLAPTMGSLGCGPRDAMQAVHDAAFRAVQLPLTGPGRLVPRDLGASARRDVRATLRRLELDAAGLDCWIPAAHFSSSDTVDRAVAAVVDACSLAGALDRCPVSVLLPADIDAAVVETMLAGAAAHGVQLIDHAHPSAAWCGMGLDPALALAQGEDPLMLAGRCDAARLSDVSQGVRSVPGAPAGQLNLVAYKAALDVSGHRIVALDLRQLPDPASVMVEVDARWRAAGHVSEG